MSDTKDEMPPQEAEPQRQDLLTSDSDEEAPAINERALLRKLDINLLPAVGLLYLLSFLDRSNGETLPPEQTCKRQPWDWADDVNSRECPY